MQKKKQSIIHNVEWFSLCPNCNYAIQFKLSTKLNGALLQEWYYGNQIDTFDGITFFFKMPNVIEKEDGCVIEQTISHQCPQCQRFLVIFTTKINKISIRNFITKIFDDYLHARQKSLWELFQKIPNFEEKLEEFKSFIAGSTLFSLYDMYDDRRMQWFSINEPLPFEWTISNIFEWMTQEYRKYFTEIIDQIEYDPMYVVKKIKEERPLNYIDLNHPDVMIYEGMFEKSLEDVRNDSKRALSQVLQSRLEKDDDLEFFL